MGNQLSTDGTLPAERIYQYTTQYNLTLAELEYCYRHYNALQFGAAVFDKPNANASKEGDNKIAQRMETEWLFARVMTSFFQRNQKDAQQQQQDGKIKFEVYLDQLKRWREARLNEKLDFIFKVLDMDQDGFVTASDLSWFVQDYLKYKFKIGDRVRVRDSPNGYVGTLKFIGSTDFKAGKWAGIELDTNNGKNNGTVQGVQYFVTEPDKGLFVEFHVLELEAHWKASRDILNRFDSVGTERVSSVTFCEKLGEEQWLSTKLMQDPLPEVLRRDSQHLQPINKKQKGSGDEEAGQGKSATAQSTAFSKAMDVAASVSAFQKKWKGNQ